MYASKALLCRLSSIHMKLPGKTEIKPEQEIRPASLKEIKEELSLLKPAQLMAVCLKLARYKKENKEMLTYLLFEADNETAYIQKIKNYLDAQFNALNKSTIYKEKKALQKILRSLNKWIKHSGSKQTEVELRIFFCQKIKSAGIPLHLNKVLGNLYQRQIVKINIAMTALHEDLQYDYNQEMKSLI